MVNLKASTKRIFGALEHAGSGTLSLATPDGAKHTFGAGAPHAALEIKDWRMAPAVLAHGDIGLGESYVEGWWDSPDIEALALFGARNRAQLDHAIGGRVWSRRAFAFADALLRANSRTGSRRNIRAHYDVGNDFYRLWLDAGLTYSSALFGADDETLEAAQTRKYDRLLDACRDRGARTLEIGCGWGGFAERAAEQGRDVTAITISQAQHDYAKHRLGPRANVRLMDYRDVRGSYDAIVSIEMVEAVGERYWPAYFRTIKERLASGGRAALQAIVVADDQLPAYRRRSDFVRRHVFPGGMLLSPGAIAAQAAHVGLAAENAFHFGRDYARTLRLWLARFEAARESVRALGYSERFMRSWRYYLATCAALFEIGKTDVMQVELRHA